MKTAGLKTWIFLGAALSMLHAAPTDRERWVAHYQAKGVSPDYEQRLVWQDDASFVNWKMDFEAAKQHCRDLKLGGSGAWRLPTIQELQALYDDPENLKNTPKGSFWSSSSFEKDGTLYIQGVRYPGGMVGRTNPINEMLVRCVREGKKKIGGAKSTAVASKRPDPAAQQAQKKAQEQERLRQQKLAREKAAREKAERERLAKAKAEQERLAKQAERERLAKAQAERARYTQLKQLALVDESAGLAWQDDADNAHKLVPWDQAADYCKALSLAGYTDWQLPTSDELKTLYGRRNDLKHLSDDVYWSSGEKEGDAEMAEYVHFGTGSRFWSFKDREFCVRCVRHP